MFKNGLEILNLISLYLSSNGELCQILNYISTRCSWDIHEKETDGFLCATLLLRLKNI